ncbi:MAG TPA: glucoamylase family protein [Cyclobacteriaceae bacterium]|nr:glucoamylase family protein [Cyclobacteriaceae bacterium]
MFNIARHKAPVFVLILLAVFVSGNSQKLKTATQAISDDSLLTLVQSRTFQYFWDGAEPVSGAARERFHVDGVYPDNDKNIVTTGGTGFGVMAILVGMERKFVPHDLGVERLNRIVTFLEKADKFHGVWPHWINGETGKVKPFGSKDDGADLVESAYLMQGLLCVRQYLKNGNDKEKKLAARVDQLWKNVEWDWHRNGKNILYWHWSPTHQWEMNFGIEGYNECLITYILAASSSTHGVPAEVYHEGWARSGGIKNDSMHKQFGLHLDLKHNGAQQYGGPLFWSHYSFLGLDPHGLKDRYADYWTHNVNHIIIDYLYCMENPKKFKGYGSNSWGLTASYSIRGYAAHAPNEDLGVISPTGAISSLPYTPRESMDALKHFYFDMGRKIFGPYGFYDAFSVTDDWYPKRYLAIDQGPEIVMIENYRSGLLWNLFMSCPEVQQGLSKLGFTNFSMQRRRGAK